MKITEGFKKGIRDIISYQKLPYTVRTSIIPFQDVLVYDGLLLEIGIRMGNDFEKIIDGSINVQ